MADRYWIASSAGNWNDTANWSASSGGAGGASVPGSGDTAIFDGNGLGNCSIGTSNFTVGSLDAQSGYTGTLSSPTFSFTIETDLKVAAGATIDIANLTLDSASISLAGGTLQGTLRTGGNCSIASGTYAFSGVTFSHPNTSNDETITFGTNITFTGNVVFNKNFSSGVLTADLATNNASIEFRGDVTLGGNNPQQISWTKGTGTITLSGSSAQSIDFNGESVEDIDVDKTAGTATLAGNVDTDSLTITSGTLDIDGQTVGVTGNVTQAAGTTVQDTTGGGVITVGGNFAINGTSGSNCTWNGPDLTITGTATASWATISDSDASGGTEVDATDNCTNGGGNTNWAFGGASAAVVPLALAATPVAPSTSKTTAPGTIRGEITPTAPATSKRVSPSPLAIGCAPIAPATKKTAAASPLSATVTPIPPSTSKRTSPAPLGSRLNPVTPTASVNVVRQPSPLAATAGPVAPGTAKRVSHAALAAALTANAPALRKRAAPSPVVARTTPVAPAVRKTAAPGALPIEVVFPQVFGGVAADPAATVALSARPTTAALSSRRSTADLPARPTTATVR